MIMSNIVAHLQVAPENKFLTAQTLRIATMLFNKWKVKDALQVFILVWLPVDENDSIWYLLVWLFTFS